MLGIALALPAHGADRSARVRTAFERAVPCPAPGPGSCASKGYEADHAEPLCAGGRDAVENYQWLTKEQHALKTKIDVLRCAVLRKNRNPAGKR